MALTPKQQKFVDAYFKLGNGPKAAIEAGYSVKHCAIEANRLLKNANIITAIDEIRRIGIQQKFNKDTFIDYALSDYKEVRVDSANRPRFLELAAKGAGIIGADNTPTTLNLSLTKNNLVINGVAEMVDGLQKMLEQE